MTYQAFVSSTFEDLKEHRAHVIRQLRRAGFHVDPMEDWTADNQEPKEFSQKRLDGCDVCVLLVAFRRGYVPDGESRSITQLEYDAAVKQDIEILVFMLQEEAPWPRKFDELDKDPELQSWREHLRKSHGAEFFTLDSRSIDLTGALGRWLAKKGSQPGLGKISRINWPNGVSPYPGLEWFDEDYAPLYFGRDQEVDDVIARMSEPHGRFLLISGASGSGKSSLVAAGLWHTLNKDGRLPGSMKWVWLRITPGDGTGPFDSLAWGLKQTFPQVSKKAVELAHELAGDPATLKALLASHLSSDQELLLFVDQLEELYTQGFKDKDLQHFLEQLVATTRDPQNRVRVVTTVRSEFIGKLEESGPVLKVLNTGYHYHLGPVSSRILQEMIEKPAQATGYEFEPHLVDAILDEAGKEPGNLPLVAYTLKQLFERRKGKIFTRAAYKAFGGVAGAIGTKADQVMDTLGADTRASFDKVFAELVHLDRDRPPTRKRVSLASFKDDVGATTLIQALAGKDCRVLVTGGEKHDTTVEVAHEKLFTAWPKLKIWIDDGGESLRLIDYAEEAAKRWHEMGGHLQELWLSGRVVGIQKALNRFSKNPSPKLEQMLRPQEMLIKRLENDALSHEDRLLIGKKLAEFEDPRPGVGLREDGLPNIEWIEISTGQIQLDNVDHVFEVKPFRLAKYPVTNIQFQAFIDCKDGFQNREWWQSFRAERRVSAIGME